MKILMGPLNTASMPAITAASLNKIRGVKARYITGGTHIYLQENALMIPIINPFTHKAFRDYPLQHIFFRLGTYLFFYSI